jgi:colanic acid biosynthesis glycosyl transferase WcaI
VKLVVLTPHFEPDTAPTGNVVTQIVHELANRGHELEVITSLPWYREHSIEPGYGGRLVRREDTPWGQIIRLHPFPTSNKRAIGRRLASFVAFSAVAAMLGARGGRADGVLAVSPPLTLGLDGWAIARARRAAYVFNIQDVYPDVAVELGVLKNPRVIKLAESVERFCYARADAVTVLSEDIAANLAEKTDASKIKLIPNFVDTVRIKPTPKNNTYRQEHGLLGKTVVMYAGNVGLSQSLELVLEAASALAYESNLVFVINGQGAAREALQRKARGLDNVLFVDAQPEERLPELLAAADIHLVALKRGLAASSVPSKTYSIMAAGRPTIASVDAGSEVARLLEGAGAGIAVPAEDPEAFTKAVRRLLDSPDEVAQMGHAARRFVEGWASPAAIAQSYEELFESLRSNQTL